jgi:signal transduction histidine kinase
MADMDKEFHDILASQGELIGSIAHDLKGLLSGIDGGIYLVDSGLKKDNRDRVDQGFEMVKRNLIRIRRTVGSVLYYVKDREIDWQEVGFEGLAASLEKELAGYAEHLGVKLELKAGEGAFEAGEHIVFSMLLNLLEYALQVCHQNKGETPPAVTLTFSREGGEVVFDLEALGFVMEEESFERALGKHYAPKGADRSHLALFIANKLATTHRGTLTLSASPERGASCFKVRLPAKNNEA